MAKLTLKCAACATTVRVEVLEPRTAKGTPLHCVFCGSTRVGSFFDANMDVEEILAQHYNMPLDLFKEVYALWTSTPGSPRHFSDFVVELEQEGMVA